MNLLDKFMSFCATILWLSINTTHSAGFDCSTIETMRPKEGILLPNGNEKYSINVNNGYQCFFNRINSVELRKTSSSSQFFTRFALQARKSQENAKRTGTFETWISDRIRYDCDELSAITNSDSHQKSAVSALWKPEFMLPGKPVRFNATVVVRNGDYYLIDSGVIEFCERATKWNKRRLATEKSQITSISAASHSIHSSQKTFRNLSHGVRSERSAFLTQTTADVGSPKNAKSGMRTMQGPILDEKDMKELSVQSTNASESQAKKYWFPAVIVAGIILLISTLFACYAYKTKQTSNGSVELATVGGPNDPGTRNPGRRRRGVSENNPAYFLLDLSSEYFASLRMIPQDSIALIKILGHGSFGEVYQGILNDTAESTVGHGGHVAVKAMTELATGLSTQNFINEAIIMSKFDHTNIVKLIGISVDRSPKYIVLELLAGGDLKTFLRQNRDYQSDINTSSFQSKLTVGELLNLGLDVARGCKYLEDNHFIHRDIAARNCLLTARSLPDRMVKIADFGMARDVYRADYYWKGGNAVLPVKWMPPEAFMDGIFTSMTDVWSFGVLLWEIFSLGYLPYPGRGNQEVMQLVADGGRLQCPNNCPKKVYLLMMACWQTGAEFRPRFSDILLQIEGLISANPSHTSENARENMTDTL